MIIKINPALWNLDGHIDDGVLYTKDPTEVTPKVGKALLALRRNGKPLMVLVDSEIEEAASDEEEEEEASEDEDADADEASDDGDW